MHFKPIHIRSWSTYFNNEFSIQWKFVRVNPSIANSIKLTVKTNGRLKLILCNIHKNSQSRTCRYKVNFEEACDYDYRLISCTRHVRFCPVLHVYTFCFSIRIQIRQIHVSPVSQIANYFINFICSACSLFNTA